MISSRSGAMRNTLGSDEAWKVLKVHRLRAAFISLTSSDGPRIGVFAWGLSQNPMTVRFGINQSFALQPMQMGTKGCVRQLGIYLFCSPIQPAGWHRFCGAREKIKDATFNQDSVVAVLAGDIA